MGDFYQVKITKAIRRLISQDAQLLESGVNERTIMYRLAMHLQSEIQEWNIDCEYNRDGVDPKRVNLNPGNLTANDDVKGTTVYPDIIAHHRGTSMNLFVIEMKTSDNITEASKAYDVKKLEAYQKDLHYKHAYFVEIPVREAFKDLNDETIKNLVQRVGRPIVRRMAGRSTSDVPVEGDENEA
jgi:hypothetical protein